MVNYRVKHSFDRILASIIIVFLSPIILLVSLVVLITSGRPVFFRQTRIGRHGIPFELLKFRTMSATGDCTITVAGDPRITKVGKYLRRWKLDELPGIWNVLFGEMSFVGPRPDVPGYADRLCGEDRRILDLRPGITGLATLKYADEERLLSQVKDPIQYNDQVIFPDKVQINLRYMDHWSLTLDVAIMFQTLFRRVPTSRIVDDLLSDN